MRPQHDDPVSLDRGPGQAQHGADGDIVRCPAHAEASRQVMPGWNCESLLPPGGPLVCECAGCGVDFLDSLARPTDVPLCTTCAAVQPCGHYYADTVEEAAGLPFCARCLEERR